MSQRLDEANSAGRIRRETLAPPVITLARSTEQTAGAGYNKANGAAAWMPRIVRVTPASPQVKQKLDTINQSRLTLGSRSATALRIRRIPCCTR
jgi:hypothetical protein